MTKRLYFAAVALYLLMLAFLLTNWLVWWHGVSGSVGRHSESPEQCRSSNRRVHLQGGRR
ncbi:MAG TPA: hypothetical protein VEL76_14785 [Gemmataceae bacterium]|nr:hypothetical protein [Gemmataceae bacterium]